MKMKCREFEIPDGEYDAKIVSIEEQEFDDREVLRIVVAVESLDKDVNNAPASALVRKSLAPNTPLAKWFEAATGQQLEEGLEVDLDDILGKTVLVVVENKINKNGDVYPRITAVERQA